ncbi:PepSY-associated TM helix domain-containing protein [Rheinheimera texasensis]|uniref:PepSY-associated TM helix domain-containing protein n=1 Tax=Rheinheimera texasensis TaxID=306205 RepID=UPI0004E0B91D|nr:PepSY-associated TM helix domain-containing protein [Rheinheimera texasensis]
MFSNILWLSLGGALGYWLSGELATWLLSWLTPTLGVVDALLWTQLTQLVLLILLAFGLLQLAKRQKTLHALAGAVLLPLAVIVSWSGTLSLYRAELDLALTPALTQARAVEIPAAQQLQLALEWQQQQAPNAAQLYVEFASARKPYLTLHLQQPGSWTLTRYWLQLPTDPAQAGLTALGSPQELTPGNSRHSVGELVFSLHYQLAGLLKSAAQPLLIGLSIALLALTLSGIYLLWQRRRQAGTTQFFGRGPLRWHLAGALLSLPWLCWYFGSALLTQYGNWAPELIKQHSAAYYQALFPTPLPQPIAATKETATTFTRPELSTLLDTPGWPVAKVQLDLTSGKWLLTEQPNWPQTAPYQLRQQSLNTQLQVLPQADYWQSTPWSLRNLGYAAHQSLYAVPALRVLLALGGVLVVLMLCGAAESYGRKQGWWLLALLRALTCGFVLATSLLILLQLLRLSPSGLALLPQLGLCWAICTVALTGWTWWQYRLQR